MAKNWTVSVCASGAGHIVLFAGTNSHDKEVFGEWKAGDGQKVYPLPERLQGLSKVWVRLETPGFEKQTDCCVKWSGEAKQKFSFDGGGEEHNIETSDHENDCEC